MIFSSFSSTVSLHIALEYNLRVYSSLTVCYSDYTILYWAENKVQALHVSLWLVRGHFL